MHVPLEDLTRPVSLEDVFQLAAGAEQLSAALHNLSSELNREGARIIWTECFFQFRHARCELQRGQPATVLGHLRNFSEHYAKLVGLAEQAVGAEDVYVRHGKDAQDKLAKSLRTFN